jgi:hypothetical protein
MAEAEAARRPPGSLVSNIGPVALTEAARRHRPRQHGRARLILLEAR